MYGGEDWVEYEIIWDVGPLGFTLGLNEGSGFPVVSRLTAESAATAVGVRPGHELIGLNGGSTKEYGFDNTVVILKAIAKPAILRLTGPRQDVLPSSIRKRGYYTLLWHHGPLGLTFTKASFLFGGVPCVKEVTGKGTCPGIRQVAAGHILVSLNGEDTNLLSYTEAIGLLKILDKPIYLSFREMPRTYEIMWETAAGPLGFSFSPSGETNSAAIRRFSATTRSGVEGLWNARIGDELCGINHTPVHQYLVPDIQFSDVTSMLSEAKQSCDMIVLTFLAMGAGPRPPTEILTGRNSIQAPTILSSSAVDTPDAALERALRHQSSSAPYQADVRQTVEYAERAEASVRIEPTVGYQFPEQRFEEQAFHQNTIMEAEDHTRRSIMSDFSLMMTPNGEVDLDALRQRWGPDQDTSEMADGEEPTFPRYELAGHSPRRSNSLQGSHHAPHAGQWEATVVPHQHELVDGPLAQSPSQRHLASFQTSKGQILSVPGDQGGGARLSPKLSTLPTERILLASSAPDAGYVTRPQPHPDQLEPDSMPHMSTTQSKFGVDLSSQQNGLLSASTAPSQAGGEFNDEVLLPLQPPLPLPSESEAWVQSTRIGQSSGWGTVEVQENPHSVGGYQANTPTSQTEIVHEVQRVSTSPRKRISPQVEPLTVPQGANDAMLDASPPLYLEPQAAPDSPLASNKEEPAGQSTGTVDSAYYSIGPPIEVAAARDANPAPPASSVPRVLTVPTHDRRLTALYKSSLTAATSPVKPPVDNRPTDTDERTKLRALDLMATLSLVPKAENNLPSSGIPDEDFSESDWSGDEI